MRLTRDGGVGRGLKVWCWSDLWRAIGEESPRGPAWLSEAATRAALGEAIVRARGEGALEGFDELLQWPGFRRRLRGRIAAWTRAERPVDAPWTDPDPLLGAQWAIFVQYRAVLKTLDAEDDEGIAAWASRSFLEAPTPRLRRWDAWTFLDLEEDSRAAWRVLESAHGRAKSVQVTLAYEEAPELEEVYGPHAPIRRRLLQLGFVECHEGPDPFRPKGLAGVERELFKNAPRPTPPLNAHGGLAVLGAPQGEGVGLVLAREVANRLEAGAAPEDILVLFRRWDDDAAVVLETLRACRLPVAAERKHPLKNEATVSALRLGMTLPVEDWETSILVQLLRNGQVRPEWPGSPPPMYLASAASVIQASRVFRGRDAVRKALDRAIVKDRIQEHDVERARLARAVFEWVVGQIDPLDRPGRWRTQVEKLHALAEGLGIGTQPGSGPDVGLDMLWGALDDQGAVLDDLGWGQRSWSWADFSREVESLVGDIDVPPSQVSEGMVRVAAVDDVAGARAAHILMGNLAEGTFPVREAVEADLDRTPEAAAAGSTSAGPLFAREMLRFLRVLGSADSSVLLVHPTSDAQGHELLPAGFLDDLLRLFDDAARANLHTQYHRFDPALVGQPELARVPTDVRVRALAVACASNDLNALTALARSPIHREVLDGTAAALRVTHRRSRNRSYDHYDGRLSDPQVMQRIAAKFGPEYPFSPSQLESYMFCPFQFYMRYVLKLVPVDERDELQEDFADRGSRIHKLLELLEQEHRGEEDTTSRLAVAERIIANDMRTERIAGSAIDAGLDLIDQRRLGRAVDRYVSQHLVYEQLDASVRPVPHLFEIAFGSEDKDSQSYPGLELGDGTASVRLQGKIDRLDLLPASGVTGFRIIDYKTGSRPSKADVKESIYLQLPLYALAVERLVLNGSAQLHDVGYWGLSADGFKPIKLPAWPVDQHRLEAFVVDLVNHLRHGVFPIDPRKEDCTHRCEYNVICRIRQIRSQGKRREDELRMELKVV